MICSLFKVSFSDFTKMNTGSYKHHYQHHIVINIGGGAPQDLNAFQFFPSKEKKICMKPDVV